MRKFEISLESLRRIETLLAADFVKGLQSEEDDVTVKMFVTHVHEMPKGTEEGEFLVVDLGVSYLQVLLISELTSSDDVCLLFLCDNIIMTLCEKTVNIIIIHWTSI